jgi:polyhydroxyalkanoate synthase subunit PhaC
MSNQNRSQNTPSLSWMKEAMEQVMASLTPAQSGLPVAKIDWDVEQLEKLQADYIEQATALWNQSLQSKIEIKDRRFAAKDWEEQPGAKFTAALYLLNSQALSALVKAVKTDPKTQSRLSFAVEQFVAASAPSNFLPLNAEAIGKAIKSEGASLSQGLQNLWHDLKQGHVSMTDESVFEVGKNVATSVGQVIYQNPYFQLIEYAPLTPEVHAKPLLIVPPCINKYYILDLKPENSLVRYASSQGFRTLVMSWANPKEELANATWHEYVEEGVIKAIEVCQSLSPTKDLNALGFCVGGTLLTSALGVLQARGLKPVKSVTLLTTLVDFSNTGILDVFIDEKMVEFRELQYASGGLMSGRDMAQTFSFLRPNDLVWNYVVGNYLKGESPPAFDLLYWNGDATNLPGPLYAWYLRNMYLENRLKEPQGLEICDVRFDLSKLDLPIYIYGSKEDHIVPIDAAYASTQIFKGKKRFVMGASGHIAGVINPPQARKRSHWVSTKSTFPKQFKDWEKSSHEIPGSWWDDWSAWLKPLAGQMLAAPKKAGNKSHPPLMPAPGNYVAVKV